MTSYTLSKRDMAWAMDVGIRRYRGLPRGADHQGRDQATVLLDAVNGACGELAVARILSVRWPALVDTFSGLPDFPDLGLEVKTTAVDYGLAIRPREAQRLAGTYVLVRGLVNPLELVGWIRGTDIRELLDQGALPVYQGTRYVPEDRLHAISELAGALWPQGADR